MGARMSLFTQVNCRKHAWLLELPVFGEGMDLPSCHHKVVEHAHIDQRQRLHQRTRQQQVRFAGVRRAGRVVVRQNYAGRIVLQRLFHHFAWIHAGMHQCTISAN